MFTMRLILNLKTTSVFTYNKTGITYKVISNKFIYEPVCIFRVRHDLRVKIKKFLINLMLIRNGRITKLSKNKYGKEDYDFLLGIYAFVGVYALAYTIFSIVLAILHIHLSNAIDWIASIVLSILSIVYVVRLNIKRAELIERKKE